MTALPTNPSIELADYSEKNEKTILI